MISSSSSCVALVFYCYCFLFGLPNKVRVCDFHLYRVTTLLYTIYQWHARVDNLLWVFLHEYVTLIYCDYPIWVCLLPKVVLNYMAFHSYEFEHYWWRLLLKSFVCTKLDIFVYISSIEALVIWTFSEIIVRILIWTNCYSSLFLCCF
jgi:hypothetical protein